MQNKGIIFYTDSILDLKIAERVQGQLSKISAEKSISIVSVSLKPMPHFGKNIHLPLQRGTVTMFKQILTALEESDVEVIFFAEHDVLYHSSHFDFIPPKEHGVFWYNVNVWKVNSETGHSLWVNNCVQVSGMCGFRDDLIQHYKERVALAEAGPWDRNWGYEPGTPGKTVFKTPFVQKTWMSEYPNLDIRHTGTLSKNRWSKDMFRDKRNCEGWTETTVDKINGWKGFKL